MLLRVLVFWYQMARIRLLTQLGYPSMFVVWLVTIPFQYLVGIWMLVGLVERFGGMAGWTSGQLLFLYGLSLMGHGLQVVTTVLTWFLDSQLNEGAFDRLMVRPLPVTFQFICGYFNIIGMIDCIPGIIILAAGWSACGLSVDLWNLATVAAVVVGAAMIRTAIYILTGAPAFWLGRSGALASAVRELGERLSHYPIDIYPRPGRWLATFVLPFAFCATIPAAALLGRDGRIAAEAWWTPVVGAAALTLAVVIIQRGLARYESTGS